MTSPGKDTLNSLWIDERGAVWQHVSYTDKPTAAFKNVSDPTLRLSGVVGSRLLADLRMLKPEGDA